MPRQNRVTPYGELIAVPDRGTFWGNRGALLDREGRLARYSRGQAWAICVLSFKGRRRQQWAPRRLTELYFLDEATGLAAGHRPCGECRYADYQAFKRAWASALGGGLAGPRPSRCRMGRWWRWTGRHGWCWGVSCWPGRRAGTGSGGRRP